MVSNLHHYDLRGTFHTTGMVQFSHTSRQVKVQVKIIGVSLVFYAVFYKGRICLHYNMVQNRDPSLFFLNQECDRDLEAP